MICKNNRDLSRELARLKQLEYIVSSFIIFFFSSSITFFFFFFFFIYFYFMCVQLSIFHSLIIITLPLLIYMEMFRLACVISHNIYIYLLYYIPIHYEKYIKPWIYFFSSFLFLNYYSAILFLFVIKVDYQC